MKLSLIDIEDEVEATVIEQDQKHSDNQKSSSLVGIFVKLSVMCGAGYFLSKLLV